MEIFPGHYFGTFRCGETDSWYTSIILLPEEVWVHEGDIVEVHTRSDMRNYQTATIATPRYRRYHSHDQTHSQKNKKQGETPRQPCPSLPTTSQGDEKKKLSLSATNVSTPKKNNGDCTAESFKSLSTVKKSDRKRAQCKEVKDEERKRSSRLQNSSKRGTEERRTTKTREEVMEILIEDEDDEDAAQSATDRHGGDCSDSSPRKKGSRSVPDRRHDNNTRKAKPGKEKNKIKLSGHSRDDDYCVDRKENGRQHTVHILTDSSEAGESDLSTKREDESPAEEVSSSWVFPGTKEKKKDTHGNLRSSVSSSTSLSPSPGPPSLSSKHTKTSKQAKSNEEEERSKTEKAKIEEDGGNRKRKRQKTEESKAERRTLMSVSKPTYFFKVRIWRPLFSTSSLSKMEMQRRRENEGKISRADSRNGDKADGEREGGRSFRKKYEEREDEKEERRELIKEFDMIEVTYEEQAPVIAGAQRRYATNHSCGDDALNFF